MTKGKTHQSELERLEALEKRAETGGGQKAIERHHERGKLTARERLSLLFDPATEWLRATEPLRGGLSAPMPRT
jgi:acetyl-CoA carboxylase carboxyltransferase component